MDGSEILIQEFSETDNRGRDPMAHTGRGQQRREWRIKKQLGHLKPKLEQTSLGPKKVLNRMLCWLKLSSHVEAMKTPIKPLIVLIQVLFVVGTLAPANGPWLKTAHLRPAVTCRNFRVHRPKMAASVRHESLRPTDHPGFAAIVRDRPRAATPTRSRICEWASADTWFTTRLKIPPSGSAAIDPLA